MFQEKWQLKGHGFHLPHLSVLSSSSLLPEETACFILSRSYERPRTLLLIVFFTTKGSEPYGPCATFAAPSTEDGGLS